MTPQCHEASTKNQVGEEGTQAVENNIGIFFVHSSLEFFPPKGFFSEGKWENGFHKGFKHRQFF